MAWIQNFPFPFDYRAAAQKLRWIISAMIAPAILCSTSALVEAADGDPSFLTVGVGGFDIFDDHTAGELDIQVRLNSGLWIFLPQAGLVVTSDGGFYAHAGFYSDFFFGRRFVLSPSISVGGYSEGSGKDLGGAIEFRSAIELAYRFDNRSRLGLQFGHLSNAHIYNSNPGEEFLILNYSIPLTSLSAGGH